VIAAERRARFESLAGEPDMARRRLVALALVANRLAEVGRRPRDPEQSGSWRAWIARGSSAASDPVSW
jgi:hypothetical protein